MFYVLINDSKKNWFPCSNANVRRKATPEQGDLTQVFKDILPVLPFIKTLLPLTNV